MPTLVARHAHDRDDLARVRAETATAIEAIPGLLETKPGESLHFALALAENAVAFDLLDDPEGRAKVSQRDARRATQLSTALFQLAGTAAGTSEVVDYDDSTLTLPTTGITRYSNLTAWFDAYWWSQLSRNGFSAAVLGEFDVADLTATGSFDDYWRYLFEALRSISSGTDVWAQSVSAAMESLNRPTVATREESVLLVLDLFGMLAALDDPDEFNRQLAKALHSHRDYWSANAERRADPRGFVALPIAALAANAADRGIQIEVESDYLPTELIDNPQWMFQLG